MNERSEKSIPVVYSTTSYLWCARSHADVRGPGHSLSMTELAYMVREDWAQRGTTMIPQSAAIRAWLGDPPYVYATWDMKKYRSDNSADREFAKYLTPASADRRDIHLSELSALTSGDRRLTAPLVVLHPYKEAACDLVREVFEADTVDRMFVIVWSPRDTVRTWLDGVGATNLHAEAVGATPDPVQVEAARCWVDEQYNGLGSGNGKAAVVQLLRVFTAAGYPLDVDTWLAAYFAAGGEFRHAEDIEKFIKEMQRGVRHRTQERYRADILAVLRDRVAEASSATAQ